MPTIAFITNISNGKEPVNLLTPDSGADYVLNFMRQEKSRIISISIVGGIWNQLASFRVDGTLEFPLYFICLDHFLLYLITFFVDQLIFKLRFGLI